MEWHFSPLAEIKMEGTIEGDSGFSFQLHPLRPRGTWWAVLQAGQKYISPPGMERSLGPREDMGNSL